MSGDSVGDGYVNTVLWVVKPWSLVDIYYSLRLYIVQGNVIHAI